MLGDILIWLVLLGTTSVLLWALSLRDGQEAVGPASKRKVRGADPAVPMPHFAREVTLEYCPATARWREQGDTTPLIPCKAEDGTWKCRFCGKAVVPAMDTCMNCCAKLAWEKQ